MQQGRGMGNQNQSGNMDILKKFRYNFHYWLRNCYQAEEMNNQAQNQNFTQETSSGQNQMNKTQQSE